MSVTENISISGAAVFTTLNTPIGSIIRVTSEQYGVSLSVVVRTQREGEDKFQRIHLEFTNSLFPLEGIDEGTE